MADLPTAPTRPAFALPPGGGFGSGGPFGAGAPRPPGMANLNAGLGAGGGGGVGGGLRGLKSRPKPMKFVEKKLDEDTIDLQWRAGALERMRALDTYRKPTPLSEECDLLHISDKRLDVHVLKEVLCLCGGNAGGRFSDQEFAECLSFCKTLPIIWDTASAVFETLDKNERKVVLSRSYKLSLEEQAARYSELVAPAPAAEAELTPPLAAEAEAKAEAEAEAGPAVEADEPEEVRHAALVRYHRLADAYTRCVRQCQDMARRKQTELQFGDSASGSGSGSGIGNNSSDSSGSSSSSSSSSRSDGGGGGSTTAADKDDDESKGKPLPDWLQILHDKYELYAMPVVAHNLEFPPKGSSTPPVTHASALKLKSFTVGKFAGYLSGIMTSTPPAGTANAEEEEAMWWLLQASTDCHLVVSSDMSYAAVKALAVQSADDSLDVSADAGISETANASASIGAPPFHLILNRTYWARRFYQFLSKMTEMKSRPKDEKGLLLFSLHVPPMDPEVNLAPTPADFEKKAQREATAKDPFNNSACV